MTSFEPGGTERQMIELVRRLDPARWLVHVPCFHARGTWLERVVTAAASVVEFPIESFRTPDALRHVWAFARWCRDRKIAIVHSTELYSNIFALPAAALARVPVRIGNRREINPDKTAAQIAMQRAAYGAAHKIVANSRAAAERLRLERVPPRKITIVPNGLDLEPFQRRRQRGRRRTVVVVANLRREKGHDVLLHAAVDVLRQFPDVVFELVGGGPEREALQARARALNVAHAVTFAGHQDEVAGRLAAADLFVLPSRSEAFPNAVLEAMAAGLPIVASAVGGILELIDDGRTGLLAPVGDPHALADRIVRVMSDATLGERLGAAARAEAHSRYSFDRMVAAFEDVYLMELSRSAKASRIGPSSCASRQSSVERGASA
ncbi:MAG: hypothetical protein DMG02_08755 [Acidobacteria bacterium]|nr:MAG: hypothetical protein DMG02_08755 [Acidobacteriota bacterium]